MKLEKWNYQKHVYEDYEIPNDWKKSLYEVELDTLVNCCQCGKEIEFGETYTSQEIHTEHGFGFMVCPECHEYEMERRLKNKDNVGEQKNIKKAYVGDKLIYDADMINENKKIKEELEHLQKENEELKNIDLTIVHLKGVADEKDRWRNKIREKIEACKPELEETDKKVEEAQTQEERVVLKCIGIRLDERIKTLQDLLKEE